MADDEVPELAAIDAGGQTGKAGAQDGQHNPVPVTLITGFLGAGKTTLVRHILTAPHGLRVAVILNEYGEGVEDAYFQENEKLRNGQGEWVELDNGCMCCSVKSEFVQALEALLAKERKPDYILIETTGMANPGPVAQALWTDEDVEAGVQLDSIITVVDALNIDRQLNAVRADTAVNEAQVQVAYADLILLNKMDLCGDEAIDRAEADIRAINSSVHIIRTTNCNVDLHTLLNRGGYKCGAEVALAPIAEDDSNVEDPVDHQEVECCGDNDRVEEETVPDTTSEAGDVLSALASGLSARLGGAGGGPASSVSDSLNVRHPSLARSSVGGAQGSTHSHSRAVSLSLDPLGTSASEDGPSPRPPMHDQHIQTVTLSTDKPLDLDRLKAFLDELLWDHETHPEDIYRVKGVLHVNGQDHKHMLQAVYELYNITPSPVTWAPNEKRLSRIVIIGRLLNKAALQAEFQKIVSGP